MYVLNYIAITHPGNIRENNEDNFYIDGKWKQDENQKIYKTMGAVKNGELIAAVCDGMGGCAKGEQASHLAVDTMNEYDKNIRVCKAPHLWQSPKYYVDAANNRICKEMKKQKVEMGTTLAMLEFYEDYVVAGNVGDSRIYRYRNHDLVQISTDHTVVERMVRLRQITEEEKKIHPMRHRITQYLGICPKEMIVEPSITQLKEIKESDCYLICSDGLTDMIENKDILEMIKQKIPLEEKAEQLVLAALEAGGTDNITIILVQVERGKKLWNIM